MLFGSFCGYTLSMQRIYKNRYLALGLAMVFVLTCLAPVGYAQESIVLPKPGTMVRLSPAFASAHLKGMVINPKDPFKFDFIINRGDKELSKVQKQEEYTKLIKYFLAALAVPDEQQWVNLSPYEKNRIIPETFG